MKPMYSVAVSDYPKRRSLMAKSFFATFIVITAFIALAGRNAMAVGGTFTVTNVSDSTSGSPTAGSLRDGIVAANNGGCVSPCTIDFAVAGAIHLITPLTVSNASGLTINGFSAPGSVANTAPFGDPLNNTLPVIVTTSSGVGTGLTINSTNVTVQGLVFTGFNSTAIQLGSSGGIVSGCYIGTVDGTSASSFLNTDGITITGGSNTIGGVTAASANLISGNTSVGINISGGTANTISRNYIGTQKNPNSGTSLPNATGIRLSGTASATAIGVNGAGNVISGNAGDGVDAQAGAHTIKGNRIGTSGDGTTALGNLSSGLALTSDNNVAGGTAAGDGNILSANYAGINSSGANNSALGNYIGTDLAGTAALPNTNYGIITGGAAMTIGGAAAGARNVISGNAGPGVLLISNNNVIQSNYIGTTAAGTAPLGNVTGVHIVGLGNQVNQNKIANSSGVGLVVTGSTSKANTFAGNLVYSNTAPQIDLNNDGQDTNDAADTDSLLPNNKQNYATISSAWINGSNVTVSVSVDSSGAAGTTNLLVELFESGSVTSATSVLGSACYNTNVLNNVAVTVPSGTVLVGDYVTATVTNRAGTCAAPTANDGTSELSAAALVTVQPGLVTNTSDSGPGSLRQAITDANSGACASPCTITFNIPNSDANFTAGVYTIRPVTQLPALLASNTILAGATQTAFNGNTNPAGPEIVINGSLAPTNTSGLVVDATAAPHGSNIEIRDVVVNGFSGTGIYVSSSGSPITNLKILGCYIGTNASGSAAIANANYGIFLRNSVVGAQIGSAVAGNVISGNSFEGIHIFNTAVSGTVILGNGIGTNALKTAGVPNGSHGIFGVPVNAQIGGQTAGEANTIAYNSGDGVDLVGSAATNAVRYNSIHSNVGLGINLGSDGVTPNDANDVDGGANALQNYPVLTSIIYTGSNTVINGTLNSVPNTTFEIDWYANTTLDASGNGEGLTYLNTTNWTTDSAGNASVSISLPGNYRSSNITATANRVNGPSRETSEFSGTAPNAAPVANTDTPTTPEETPVTFDPRANDVDANGDALTITGATLNTAGSGTLTCGTTSCTFTPAAEFSGAVSISYTVADGFGGSSVGAINLTVTPVNDPPIANPDMLTVTEDTAGSVNVVANDTDIDTAAGGLAVTSYTNGTKGSVVCTTAGVCTYTPNANQTGADSFTYTVTDGTTPVTGTVSVTINAVNDPPVANADTLVTSEETAGSVNVLTNDTDVDTPPASLTVSSSTHGANGTVSCTTAGVCTYTPAANFSGTDSFTYTVTDGTTPQTGTVSVTVSAVNDGPVANPDTLTTAEDTPATVNVLTNDTDVDTPAAALTVTSFTNGTKGTVSCTTAGVCAYTPSLNQNGSDSFTYTVSDGTASATGSVSVTINAVDDPPVTSNDTLTTPEDTPGSVNVLTNDTDVDTPAGSRQVTSFTQGTNGTVSCTTAGICTYTPAANFTGPDSFTYVMTDGTTPQSASVSVTVTAVNDPPVANPDALTTAQNSAGAVNVLANDTDPDTPAASLTVTSSTNGTKGTVSCTAAGNCTYTPNLNQTGSDSFTYTVSDGVSSVTGSVSVNISGSVADLSITKSGPVRATPNSTIAYEITVTNNGSVAATGVTVSDPTPARTRFVVNRGDCTTAFPCSLGTLAPGQTKSISSQYVVTSGGSSITNTATVSSTPADPVTANNSATVTTSLSCSTAAPTNLEPANGATNVPAAGTLRWQTAGATSYNVYLGRAGSGCSTPFATVTNASFVSYSGLEEGVEYEWRVEGVVAGCSNVTSSCQRFTVGRACSLTPPVITAPANGSVQQSPVHFTWLSAGPAGTQYQLFASINGGPSSAVAPPTSELSLDAALPEGTITWTVVATAAGCAPLQSQSGSFRVCALPAPVPSVVGETTSGQLYTVSWTGQPGVTYELQEATNAAFTDAVTTTLNTTSQTFRKTVGTGAQAFFYRVRGLSECLQQFGPYSATARIVISPSPRKSQRNINVNVAAGSKEVVVQEVFFPGEPGAGLITYVATVDKPWLSVRPSTGVLPPDGVTLQLFADPAALPNGTFTGTITLTLTTPTNSRSPIANGTVVKSTPISISLVTPVSPVPAATPGASALVIPSVGHLDGLNSHWQSDIRVTNTSADRMQYQLTFTPAGGGANNARQTTIDVDGGATTALDDIVRNWYGVGSFGDSANGTLQIAPVATSSAPVDSRVTVASSRTYNVTENGTLGQYIPAVPFASFIGRVNPGAAQQVLSLQQIAQTSAFRTNVGLVEASGNPASVALSISNSAGVKIDEMLLDLAGGEQRQMNAFLAERGISNMADGRIEVRVTGGEGRVTAYASVVDGITNDPLLVSGVPLGQAGANRYVLPGVADLNVGIANWRTDMRVFNSSSIPQPATLSFFPQGGGAPRTSELVLNPGEVRTLDNVLQSTFGITNDGGAMHVSTPVTSNLVVTGRTYNMTANGTYGQFVPAVTAAEAVGNGDRALQIQQVEDSVRFRTNVGLAEVTGNDVEIEISVILPDSRVTPRTTMTLPANSFRQMPVIRDFGLGNVYNARIAVRVIGGAGRVTAYGSVIDMETQDPTYVPAQ